jgi:hypothetical protein
MGSMLCFFTLCVGSMGRGGRGCIRADETNSWTANVYFKAKNGTFKRVPQVPNRFLFNDKFTTQTEGGVTVYYIAPKKGVVTAFKPGFRSK